MSWCLKHVVPPFRRVNGFERPFDPHQVASWVVFSLLMASFFVLYTPVHSDVLGLVLTAAYGLLSITVVWSAVKCMNIDPKDQGVAASGAAQHWCYYCEKQVNSRSKHCRRCNKCVEVFDHHCPWLNTCIGKHNYSFFLALLSSVFALLSLQMATSVQACVMARTHDDADERLNDTYGSMPTLPYAILNGVSGGVALLAWLAVLQLTIFHAGLISRGMTTYEFIIAQRQRKKERDAKNGGKPPSPLEACIFEAQNQAPCFAVCKLCNESPTARRVDAKATTTAAPTTATTTRTSAQALPGRVRPAAGTEMPAYSSTAT